MKNENDVVDFRVVLTGELTEIFNRIKKTHGIDNNTEAVRFIIKDYYELYKITHEAFKKMLLAMQKEKAIRELINESHELT